MAASQAAVQTVAEQQRTQETALKSIVAAVKDQPGHLEGRVERLETWLGKRAESQDASLKQVEKKVEEHSSTLAALPGGIDTVIERRTSTLERQVASIVEGQHKQAKKIDKVFTSVKAQQPQVIPGVDKESGALQRVKIVLPDGVDIPINRSGTDDAFDVFRARKKDGTLSFLRVEVPYYHYYTADRQLHLQGDWNAPFGHIADDVIASGTTKLLHDRLYTLWQGVRNAAHSSAAILEVGAWKGGSTRFLAEACRHFGKSGTIYSCDTFTGPVQVTAGIDGTRTAAQFEDISEDVRVSLQPYANVDVIKGDIETTASRIRDTTLSMLHVDVNVYQATLFTLNTFAPRLEPGGTIVVDDYGSVTCPGVKQSVDEFAAAHPQFRLTHLLTGQAALIRIVQ